MDRIVELTTACREAYLAGSAPEDRAISELVDLATADATDDEASRALFRDIVEPLADRFDPAASRAYESFFRQVLDGCRNRPGFEPFDQRLRQLERVSAQPPAERPQRCLVLSRITAGADVAVVSPILNGLRETFPDAQVLLVGGNAFELFERRGGIESLPLEYQRGGTLKSRLLAWVSLVDQLEPLADEATLVIDPDSRLTQLGLLPLPIARTLHFNSRDDHPESKLPLAQLSANWFGEQFHVKPPKTFVAPPPLTGLRGQVATVNFGVGGNDSKRVSEEFEIAAVRTLVEANWRVVVDKGAGEVEATRTQRIVDALNSDAVVGWSGSLPNLAAQIASSRLYLGYDSAGGHIAAAAGVRGIDIFAGAVSKKMRQRWSPWGPKPAQVIPADEVDPLERLKELL